VELIIAGTLAAAIRYAVPLVYASIGGIFSERSGVINIALEGMMLVSAFFAVVATNITKDPWIGLLAAIVAGSLVGAILAVVTVVMDADQIIGGFGINVLAIGIVGFLMVVVFSASGTSPRVPAFTPIAIPLLSDIPILGPALFTQSVPGLLLFAIVPAALWLLYRTRLGLRLRASGENPAAVASAGVNVTALRFLGVMLSGALAGVAGAYISIGLFGVYIEGMTGGRGFIALAIVILSGWNPVRAMAIAVGFGLAQAAVVQIGQQVVPQEFLSMVPYALTVFVLALFGRRLFGPAAAGSPFHAE
jgi:general nucleoside transport system permease protein